MKTAITIAALLAILAYGYIGVTWLAEDDYIEAGELRASDKE